ncbi:hypothetical protein B0T19DRAFT_121995 [Cercophora scortea]|uniref:Uncharacterized protein n=1 Tax=Cercophora scortea TaxID=314031 RepID=A0AAE0IXV9_9PEZI|nr:hypothetical protein B0T19DRAFT_121995 [Cercophora scortea]
MGERGGTEMPYGRHGTTHSQRKDAARGNVQVRPRKDNPRIVGQMGSGTRSVRHLHKRVPTSDWAWHTCVELDGDSWVMIPADISISMPPQTHAHHIYTIRTPHTQYNCRSLQSPLAGIYKTSSEDRAGDLRARSRLLTPGAQPPEAALVGRPGTKSTPESTREAPRRRPRSLGKAAQQPSPPLINLSHISTGLDSRVADRHRPSSTTSTYQSRGSHEIWSQTPASGIFANPSPRSPSRAVPGSGKDRRYRPLASLQAFLSGIRQRPRLRLEVPDPFASSRR